MLLTCSLPSLLGSYMDTQPLRSLGSFMTAQDLVGLRHRNRNVQSEKSSFNSVACFKAVGEFSVALIKKAVDFPEIPYERKSSPNT